MYACVLFLDQSAVLAYQRSFLLLPISLYPDSATTVLVLTLGSGVDGFTLDPDTSRFLHTHKDIRIPSAGPIYSFNEANFHDYEEPVKRYLDALKEGSSSVGIRSVCGWDGDDATAAPAGTCVSLPITLVLMLVFFSLLLLLQDRTLDTLVHSSQMSTMCSRTVVSTDIHAPFRTRTASCDCFTNPLRWHSLWSRRAGPDRRGTGESSMSSRKRFTNGKRRARVFYPDRQQRVTLDHLQYREGYLLISCFLPSCTEYPHFLEVQKTFSSSISSTNITVNRQTKAQMIVNSKRIARQIRCPVDSIVLHIIDYPQKELELYHYRP